MDGMTPSRHHRKALRAAALEMHRIASDMRHRRGHVPRDEPTGYVDAFSSALRERARLLETSAGSTTCAGAKRAALDLPSMHPPGSPDRLAHDRATGALLTIVNMLAQRSGIDPYEGLRPAAPGDRP